ncbi:unnamed protein product [Cyprideis torosa]|uniref:Uncharacterized protein n=1 Tax=Cyprideis torosa TaxID=163714 RepID=A0A7R8ZQB6_9CRUS|nr:unnamed protein product [Cyprideis torosa]CAG0900971.1 unnamed protein product [Cyprideis torosa]
MLKTVRHASANLPDSSEEDLDDDDLYVPHQHLTRSGCVSLFGTEVDFEGLDCFAASVSFILAVEVAAFIIRKLVSLDTPSVIQRLILEFIATFELCACCYELATLADAYGIVHYGVGLFLLTFWWSTQWKEETACPSTIIVQLLFDKAFSFSEALLRLLVQVASGLSVFRVVSLFWNLHWSHEHYTKSKQISCVTDLQVDPTKGMIIEGVGTALCVLSSSFLASTQLRISGVVDSFIATAAVVAAFNYSGGYFNPILASSLKLFCDGTTTQDHFMVYWIGATIGAVIAVIMTKVNFRTPKKKATKED